MNTIDQTGIYNMALAAVGVSQFVKSPIDGSIQANVLNTFWQNCVDQCLEDVPWGFANRNFVLVALTITPPPGWSYIFQYPADCVKARAVKFNSGSLPATPPGYMSGPLDYCFYDHHKTPFAIVENEANGGLAIVTNIPSPVLIYTARIANMKLWSASFVNALVWLLATKIIAPLSCEPSYATTAGAAYQAALIKAAANDMNEGQDRPDPESELVRVRG